MKRNVTIIGHVDHGRTVMSLIEHSILKKEKAIIVSHNDTSVKQPEEKGITFEVTNNYPFFIHYDPMFDDFKRAKRRKIDRNSKNTIKTKYRGKSNPFKKQV